MDPLIKKMMETGIKSISVQFHAAVNNADNVPENYFSDESNVPSRRVETWVHPSWSIGLTRQLNSKKEMIYKWFSISTSIFGSFGKMEESACKLEVDPYAVTQMDQYNGLSIAQVLGLAQEELPRAESNLAKQVGAEPFNPQSVIKRRGRKPKLTE